MKNIKHILVPIVAGLCVVAQTYAACQNIGASTVRYVIECVDNCTAKNAKPDGTGCTYYATSSGVNFRCDCFDGKQNCRINPSNIAQNIMAVEDMSHCSNGLCSPGTSQMALLSRYIYVMDNCPP
jgi:hypothetical protein